MTRCLRIMAVFLTATMAAATTQAGPTTREGEEKPLLRRIADRTFPSVFQAWNPAENLKGEDALVTAARHDLIFHGPGYLGLQWNRQPVGLATGFTPGSIAQARQKRKRLLKLNPNLVLLAEIRYRDARKGFLPDGHEWWMYKDGKPVPGWAEGGFYQLDYRNPEYRRHVAARCRAVVETGAVDGVMLDWWQEDEHRLALAKAVRAAVGQKALILVNANDRTTPLTAEYVNGYFMECYRSRTAGDWKRIADTLAWAEKNLRPPRINCLETWYHGSRRDLNLMRATTALSLTHSDGYCLFSDPNPLPRPDHLHDWYPFWNKSLGRPLGPGKGRPDKAVQREFENGTVVYNPMGNQPVTVTFSEDRTSLGTGRRGRKHLLAGADGDIYLKPQTRTEAAKAQE
ncbi:MAG: hypothetical protein AMJ81_11805 [Phycisphaerae bacterium SM23_33]|nr:MAG: hypothetical protein AMJ81_11805 [Phycisphaerae bacterium SM23_33]